MAQLVDHKAANRIKFYILPCVTLRVNRPLQRAQCRLFHRLWQRGVGVADAAQVFGGAGEFHDGGE